MRAAVQDFVRYDEDYWGVQELQGTTVGIVGMGGLGEAIAQRCLGFGCHVIGLARTPRPQAEADAMGIEGVWGPSQLDDLLRQADWLVVTCPLTDETRGMIDEAQLRQMKPSARIIVLSRGAIVAERPLLAALEEGRLSGAAFDSFCGEELAEDFPNSEMIGDGAFSSLFQGLGTIDCDQWRDLLTCRARQLLPTGLPTLGSPWRHHHATYLRCLSTTQCPPGTCSPRELEAFLGRRALHQGL